MFINVIINNIYDFCTLIATIEVQSTQHSITKFILNLPISRPVAITTIAHLSAVQTNF
jgi:hypothetical protein